MSTTILATKLYVPPPRPKVVSRPRLIERMNESLQRAAGITLISAPAGFGKTTLVSEWVSARMKDEGGRMKEEDNLHPSSLILHPSKVAWLSLDEGDNDPTRFLTYLVAAVQTIVPKIGEGLLAVLQSPQPPPAESILTALLNEITTLSDNFILVLDDYHVIDSQPVDQALVFLVEHLPPQMHLVIATREDPSLPLARLRVRNQLIELRATDLRFTPAEAAEFLNRVMGLNLSAADVAALENRTEGWIAGLQLAAISMQGHPDAASFIQSFTGSHHFVLDYLIEEVLHQQSESVQTFLLRTSILDRLCGPLCEAVLEKAEGGRMKDEKRTHSASSSSILHPSSLILEQLEHANLFIVPLDNDRQWYRYHHLFGDLLRKRLGQSLTPGNIAELHIRASQWYEDHGLEIEAFQHAAAANDVERAERLMEGKGIPLHFRGALNTILEWLASLPKSVLDARPLLWVRSATMALTAGQTTGIEEKLQAAEAALRAERSTELDDKTRDLIGQIACARATLALTQYQPETVIIQSHRALEYLPLENLAFRFTANWTLSVAHHLQGDRAAAGQALAEAVSISEASGGMFSTILALSHLGLLQELENQLYRAAETYQRVLQLVSDQPLPNAAEARLGLARICYEWNDLDAAAQHGQQALLLARQYGRLLDRFILCEVFLARLKLAQGDVNGAAAVLAQTDRATREQNFVQRMPEVAAAQVLTLLRQGDVAAAARLAQTHDLPISRARVLLAQGDPSAALAVLEPLRQQMEAKGWQDEQLKVMVLQAVALHAHGEKDQAVRLLREGLILAEPGGFVRLFVDEGEVMRLLIVDFRHLHRAAAQRAVQVLLIEKQKHRENQQLIGYADKILAAFAQPMDRPQSTISTQHSAMIEPLSQRELEILKLLAQGLSNREISARLFLALDTVKGHNRRIFDKLQVKSRTEAIARARELGLL